MTIKFTGGIATSGQLTANPKFTAIEPDPDFSSVVLLMHMETLTDSSNSGHTPSLNGSATLSSSQAKFGTQSASIPAVAGSFISIPDDIDFTFGTGDWTMEAWVYINTPTGNGQRAFLSKWLNNGNLTLHMSYQNDGKYSIAWSDNGSFDAGKTAVGTAVFPTATWAHMAVVRDGTTMRSFIDGTADVTLNMSTSVLFDSSVDFRIGNNENDASSELDGFIDEVRITKGVARYTANFDVPTTAFSDA